MSRAAAMTHRWYYCSDGRGLMCFRCGDRVSLAAVLMVGYCRAYAMEDIDLSRPVEIVPGKTWRDSIREAEAGHDDRR